MIISNKMITKSAVLNASLAVVWEKWTTHEGLLSFFGKDNKIELSPNDHQTMINLTHLGWLEGEEWEIVYAYFEEAWGLVLNWLVDSCNKIKNAST